MAGPQPMEAAVKIFLGSHTCQKITLAMFFHLKFEIAPTFYYGKIPKINEKDLKIPILWPLD